MNITFAALLARLRTGARLSSVASGLTFIVAVGCSGKSVERDDVASIQQACGMGGSGGGGMGSMGGDAVAGEALFRYECIECHTIAQGARRGPDLQNVQQRRSPMWLRNWLANPVWMTANDATARQLLATWGIQMPNLGLTSTDISNVLAFIQKQSAIGPIVPTPPISLTSAQFDDTKQLYFNRCAGCHGTYRAGATGPDIGQARSRALGTDVLAATMNWGTPSGMPPWGKSGILTSAQVQQLAAYLQLPPPDAPPLPLDQIRQSWNLITAPAQRPTTPQTTRKWENFFGVVLRDPGQVAIYDGDTKEELARIDTGFAVHILRSSATGRYFYAIGRDGRVTLIDLWTSVPTKVADVQGCFDARSVEGSKLPGYEDRYVVEGCYWPPQYVVFDGLTLQPLQRVDLPMTTYDTQETLKEVRVASIVASPYEPLWALSLKETGYVGLVDYSTPAFALVNMIPADRYLHDGGWDHTRRYFAVAANALNEMAIVDVQQKAFVTKFVTGKIPHPGRGANWLDPLYGWVDATTHLGEGKLSVYGADPVNHPEYAWRVVREVTLPSAGSLFLKTHDRSPWVLMDMPLSSDPNAAEQVCAYSKASGALDHCWSPSDAGRSVHFEFNKDGTEVWVSVWSTTGELVIYDSTTLQELQRITGVPTPTGKFNVYNTAHDVY